MSKLIEKRSQQSVKQDNTESLNTSRIHPTTSKINLQKSNPSPLIRKSDKETKKYKNKTNCLRQNNTHNLMEDYYTKKQISTKGIIRRIHTDPNFSYTKGKKRHT
jgi:hypothetical protein